MIDGYLDEIKMFQNLTQIIKFSIFFTFFISKAVSQYEFDARIKREFRPCLQLSEVGLFYRFQKTKKLY